MVILVEMAILGAVIGIQREMNGTVQWLFFLSNVEGESSVHTWNGILYQFLLVPVSM